MMCSVLSPKTTFLYSFCISFVLLEKHKYIKKTFEINKGNNYKDWLTKWPEWHLCNIDHSVAAPGVSRPGQ